MLDSVLTAFAVTSARLRLMAAQPVSDNEQALAAFRARVIAEQLRLDREFKVICAVCGLLLAIGYTALIVGLCSL